MPDPITYAEHPSTILAHAVDLSANGKRFALVTSVAIQGGAARELGSLAVVDADGHMTGYLSNGCIDRDIQLHALDALRSGEKKLIRYGDGSKFADLSLPCGGSLSVLIDPTPDQDALQAVHVALSARQPATLHFAIPAEGPEPARTLGFSYRPKFRLVLAGRGAIFRAMAQAAHSTGFEVICLSPDAEDLTAVAPLTVQPPVHLTSPSQGVDLAALDANSAFLTLFHDHDWEPELLRAALTSTAPFLGCLGSQRTHMLRLGHLRSLGVAEGDIARLHGPIGLVPSLREAPLIAISTLAEIIATLPPSISLAHD